MLSDLILRNLAALNRPYLVAIDGLGGAGKSTLAEQIAGDVPEVTIVHFDDFYRVMDPVEREGLSVEEAFRRSFDWERLEAQVLKPLRAQQTARYERYDWPTNQLAETHTVRPDQIVLVEGVGCSRPELRGYYDLRVWVETSYEKRHRRMIARGENPPEQIARWEAIEAYYAQTHRPHESADLVIAGEP